MNYGLFVLAICAVVNAVAFFGLRYVTARTAGVRGAQVVFATEIRRPWAGVSLGRRALFAFAGPLGCYACAVAFTAIGLMSTGRNTLDEASMRITVMAGGPASDAGLLNGDKILSVNDETVADWTALRAAVARHPGEQIRVKVRREDREMVFSPTTYTTGKIGVGPHVTREDFGVITALGQGLARPAVVFVGAVKGAERMFSGGDKPELSGPVGIVKGTGDAAKLRLGDGLQVLGTMTAYYLWIPTLLALIFFPRGGRREHATS